MLVPLIHIGNSRGLRIPKSVITELGFEGELEMSVEKDALVIRSPHSRKGWAAAFTAMHSRGEDKLVIGDVYTTMEFNGHWKW